MPGLLHRTAQFSHGPAAAGSLSSHGIWSKHAADIGFDQLQKFWSQLPVEARQELLKVDKHALFEQARKNLYCSRCNGLLLEGFSQIVMYGKSLQQESACVYPNRTVRSKVQGEGDSDSELDDVLDPSVHPWGGLATTRDGALTLLDCFISARSLRALQNVFNSARARERERELLYPDACGGGGRGWISQGMISYGRGHGTRETCALHTARLSCDTLVDFWSALSDETRLSLLRMKEEDFIERLMYRFDSKRFCRDCRRNVIREFKELKELKRMRREPRCSSWFCVADTAFQYEVSEDTVQADWHQSFTESVGTYHHFEWAIGTGEGKSDILEFEDVGMDGKVYMNGLDLGGLSACFITLRAWKLDGRCTELCVKAHALKGQPCVHRRLIVGDGFVTITKGESIRDFFEHAEEVEEEEDDDAMDKDGNEYDGDGSRPQKHAKSPELAREFLLDAATVIFKEQVEKAFREGTARQNAHSIFVCLSLKLLEDRIHVACKEIITLEKQMKLLEEEEKDRREEEERKERRRAKEREKKLRRKERLKGKERERERKHMEPELLHFALPACNDSSTSTPNTVDSGDSISEAGDIGGLSNPTTTNEKSLENPKNGSVWHQCQVDGEVSPRDGRDSLPPEQFRLSRRKLRVKRETLFDQASKWYDKRHSVHNEETTIQHYESDRSTHGYAMDTFRCNTGALREKTVKTITRPCNLKFSEKFHCSNSRTRDRYDFQSCSCNQQDECRQKDEFRYTTVRQGRVIRSTNKAETPPDGPRTLLRGRCGIPEGKIVVGREVVHTKQVWEPMDARKKCAKSISDPDPDVTVSNAVKTEVGSDKDEQCCEAPLGTPDGPCSLSSLIELEDGREGSKKSDNELKSSPSTANDCDPIMLSSSSDTFSSCPSEGGSTTGSSTAQNTESSSTSDSEDTCQQSDGHGNENDDLDCKTSGDVPLRRIITGTPTPTHELINAIPLVSDMLPHPQQHMPPMHMPVFPSTMGYGNHNVSLWSANTPTNGLMPFPQHNQYMYPSPFGYSVTVNQSPAFPMQYNAVQPLLSLQQRSLYQSVDRVFVPSMNDKTKNSEAAPVLPRNGYPLERPCSTRQSGGVGNVAKPSSDAPSFSLFHFGGPYNVVNPAPLKEQISCGFASSITCSKEETKIEEYSLFAASTGSRFSFF